MAGLTFGQRSADYVPVTIDPDDIWLKTIKVGETKIRFLEGTADWITFREHYDPDVRKSFPCTEDAKTCVGCTGATERVRGKNRKYAFNALDSQGRLNVYKIGSKFRDQLVSREKRADGTLLDRDYLLIREGTTMENTLYSYEPGDKSRLDYDEELLDIQKILSNQYLQYLEAMEGEEPKDSRAHDEAVKPASKKADEAQSTTQEIEPLEDWPTSRMKAMLDDVGIEFPLRASKGTLVPLIEEWAKANPKDLAQYGLSPF